MRNYLSMSVHRTFWKHFLLPVHDLLRNTRIQRCRRLLEETQWLSQKNIERLQLARLRRIVSHAYHTVPYYRAAFREGGVRPEDIKDISDLEKIPLLTKAILRSRNDELVSTSYHSTGASREHTSGTTSKPVSFLRDNSDRSWGWAAALRAYSWAGYELGDKEALVWQRTFASNKSTFLQPLYDEARRTLLVDSGDVSAQNANNILGKLKRFHPHFIRGYSGALHRLAEYLLEAGQCLDVRGVIHTSSMIYEAQRKVIRQAFRCPVFSFYGAREVMAIASECEEHTGLHVSSENLVLEVLRDGEAASPGEVGSLVITNLTNYSMPLIRYEIGDLGRTGSSPCSCGRGLPVLESLEGRKFEHIVNSDGSHTVLRPLEAFFSEVPVKDFQVVVASPDLITVKIVEGEAYSEVHDRIIKNNLKWRGKSEVEIQKVGKISPAPSGKPLRFVSYTSSQNTT